MTKAETLARAWIQGWMDGRPQSELKRSFLTEFSKRVTGFIRTAI